MGMNEAELERVVGDLQELVGEPMTGAWQHRRDRIVLRLGPALLLFVPRGPFARVHTIGQKSLAAVIRVNVPPIEINAVVLSATP